MENREELIRALIKHFLIDFRESIKPLSLDETIDFSGILVEYLKGVYNHEPTMLDYNYEGSPFDEDDFIEAHLLKPYRHKMVPFIKSNLKLYFAKDEFSKTQLLQKLKISVPILNDEEYQDYIIRLFSLLENIKKHLYLKEPIELVKDDPIGSQKLIDNEEEMINQGFKSKSTEYTRPRQVLLYYFVLKLMGMTKLDNSARAYSKFAHVLFAWPIDNIDNSSVYKLLKKAPYLKKDDKVMLKDLEFIKEQFKLIESEEGVAMVQKEIDSLKR